MLFSLGGGAAPPDLAGDLRRLIRLPPEGLSNLWQVLGPCLAETVPPETEQLLDVFCSAYHISDDDLGRAIKACRFLVQSASRIDTPAELFAQDLAALCPDAPVIAEVLLAGYERAKAASRHAVATAALMAHGKVLVGANWRVDTIESSDRGGKIRLPVVMLTLQYREGPETGRITLQLLPDTMRMLKGICEQIVPEPRGERI